MLIPLLALGGLGVLAVLAMSDTPSSSSRGIRSSDASGDETMRAMIDLAVYASGASRGQNDRLAGRSPVSDPASSSKEIGYDLTDPALHAKYNEGYQTGYYPQSKAVT